MQCFKVIKTIIFFSDSAIFDSKPNEISKSKKLLVLLSSRFLIGGVILVSVINRPKSLSFLAATSKSIKIRP